MMLHGLCREQWVRRGAALALALLWSLYAVQGAFALCRAMPPGPPTSACPSGATPAAAQTPAPQCHMANCPMMRGGRCCCRNGTAPTPQTKPQATFCACCDHGAPAVIAAATSWPVVVPELSASAVPHVAAPDFGRPADTSAESLFSAPATPPPCLL